MPLRPIKFTCGHAWLLLVLLCAVLSGATAAGVDPNEAIDVATAPLSSQEEEEHAARGRARQPRDEQQQQPSTQPAVGGGTADGSGLLPHADQIAAHLRGVQAETPTPLTMSDGSADADEAGSGSDGELDTVVEGAEEETAPAQDGSIRPVIVSCPLLHPAEDDVSRVRTAIRLLMPSIKLCRLGQDLPPEAEHSKCADAETELLLLQKLQAGMLARRAAYSSRSGAGQRFRVPVTRPQSWAAPTFPYAYLNFTARGAPVTIRDLPLIQQEADSVGAGADSADAAAKTAARKQYQLLSAAEASALEAGCKLRGDSSDEGRCLLRSPQSHPDAALQDLLASVSNRTLVPSMAHGDVLQRLFGVPVDSGHGHHAHAADGQKLVLPAVEGATYWSRRWPRIMSAHAIPLAPAQHGVHTLLAPLTSAIRVLQVDIAADGFLLYPRLNGSLPADLQPWELDPAHYDGIDPLLGVNIHAETPHSALEQDPQLQIKGRSGDLISALSAAHMDLLLRPDLPRAVADKLGLRSGAEDGNTSACPLRYPSLLLADSHTTVVQPGQVLFVPSGYAFSWHALQATTNATAGAQAAEDSLPEAERSAVVLQHSWIDATNINRVRAALHSSPELNHDAAVAYLLQVLESPRLNTRVQRLPPLLKPLTVSSSATVTEEADAAKASEAPPPDDDEVPVPSAAPAAANAPASAATVTPPPVEEVVRKPGETEAAFRRRKRKAEEARTRMAMEQEAAAAGGDTSNTPGAGATNSIAGGNKASRYFSWQEDRRWSSLVAALSAPSPVAPMPLWVGRDNVTLMWHMPALPAPPAGRRTPMILGFEVSWHAAALPDELDESTDAALAAEFQQHYSVRALANARLEITRRELSELVANGTAAASAAEAASARAARRAAAEAADRDATVTVTETTAPASGDAPAAMVIHSTGSLDLAAFLHARHTALGRSNHSDGNSSAWNGTWVHSPARHLTSASSATLPDDEDLPPHLRGLSPAELRLALYEEQLTAEMEEAARQLKHVARTMGTRHTAAAREGSLRRIAFHRPLPSAAQDWLGDLLLAASDAQRKERILIKTATPPALDAAAAAAASSAGQHVGSASASGLSPGQRLGALGISTSHAERSHKTVNDSFSAWADAAGGLAGSAGEVWWDVHAHAAVGKKRYNVSGPVLLAKDGGSANAGVPMTGRSLLSVAARAGHSATAMPVPRFAAATFGCGTLSPLSAAGTGAVGSVEVDSAHVVCLTVDGLLPSHAYTFRVSAITPAGVSAGSDESEPVLTSPLTVPLPLAAPPVAAEIGPTFMELSWAHAPSVDNGGLPILGYLVLREVDSNDPSLVAHGGNSPTNFTHPIVLPGITTSGAVASSGRIIALAPNVRYRFLVLPVNALGVCDGASEALGLEEPSTTDTQQHDPDRVIPQPTEWIRTARLPVGGNGRVLAVIGAQGRIRTTTPDPNAAPGSLAGTGALGASGFDPSIQLAHLPDPERLAALAQLHAAVVIAHSFLSEMGYDTPVSQLLERSGLGTGAMDVGLDTHTAALQAGQTKRGAQKIVSSASSIGHALGLWVGREAVAVEGRHGVEAVETRVAASSTGSHIFLPGLGGRGFDGSQREARIQATAEALAASGSKSAKRRARRLVPADPFQTAAERAAEEVGLDEYAMEDEWALPTAYLAMATGTVAPFVRRLASLYEVTGRLRALQCVEGTCTPPAIARRITEEAAQHFAGELHKEAAAAAGASSAAWREGVATTGSFSASSPCLSPLATLSDVTQTLSLRLSLDALTHSKPAPPAASTSSSTSTVANEVPPIAPGQNWTVPGWASAWGPRTYAIRSEIVASSPLSGAGAVNSEQWSSRIVLFERGAVPIAAKVRAAAAAGALGVIIIDEPSARCGTYAAPTFTQRCVQGSDQNRGMGFAAADPAAEWEAARIPALIITRDAGMALRKVVAP